MPTFDGHIFDTLLTPSFASPLYHPLYQQAYTLIHIQTCRWHMLAFGEVGLWPSRLCKS